MDYKFSLFQNDIERKRAIDTAVWQILKEVKTPLRVMEIRQKLGGATQGCVVASLRRLQ